MGTYSKADVQNAANIIKIAANEMPDDYHPDAQYFFDRCVVKPSAPKKQAISDFIVACEGDNNWQYVSVLLLFRLHDMQTRLLNLKRVSGNPYDGVPMNVAGKAGITAVASGLKGDGFSHIRAGSYACPPGLQNDHHIGMVGETAVAMDGLACGNNNAGIVFRNTSNAFSERVNSDFISAAQASGKYHVILNRRAKEGYTSIKDGTTVYRTKVSVAPSQSPFTIFANVEKASFWPGEASAFHAGSGFPTPQAALFFASRLASLNAALIA